jgi:hypothetical protein
MTPQAGYDALRACPPQHCMNTRPRQRGRRASRLLTPIRRGRAAPSLCVAHAPGRTRTPWGNLRFPPHSGSPFSLRLRRGLQEGGYRRNGTVNRLSDGQPYAHRGLAGILEIFAKKLTNQLINIKIGTAENSVIPNPSRSGACPGRSSWDRLRKRKKSYAKEAMPTA